MSLLRAIATSPLFQALERPRLERIAALASEVSYPAEHALFREGDALSNLYVVHRGSVRLTMDARIWSQGTTLRSMVTVMGPGGTFGWSALVEPKVATLSATTAQPSSLVIIPGASLRLLMDNDPAMGYRVMTALAELVALRLRAIGESIASERALDLLRRPIPA